MAEDGTESVNVPETMQPEARRRFREALRDAGFSQTEADERKECWRGNVTARWRDVATGEDRSKEHRVSVVLWPGFPFQQPSAFPEDSQNQLPQSRHAVPLPNGSLCLYGASYRPDTQRGWAAWRTGEEYLARLGELLSRIYSGEWDEADRPPDLHTAFRQHPAGPSMIVIGGSWSPPRDARSGRFGIWRKDATVALADRPVAGPAEVGTEPTDDLALMFLGFSQKRREAVGSWIRLEREPGPRKSLGALLKEIDRAARAPEGWALAECKRLIGSDAGGKRPVVLALGYPDSSVADGESWLFLEARPEDAGKPMRWREPQTLDRTQLLGWETAAASRDALMRRTGPMARAVAGRTVVIFGVGAIGSAVAVLLARSGIEHLILVDSDRLRPGNIVRHVAALTEVGSPKTRAVKWQILSRTPNVEVEEHGATWDPGSVRRLVQRADVSVDATAEQPFNLLLNEICVGEGRTLVQAETARRAAIGRVRVVRPGRDACILCHHALAGTPAYPTVPAGDEGEFFDTGCGVPTVEAPAVDVEATANWAARAVLWILRDSLGPQNHLLLVNDQEPGLTGDLAIVGSHWSVFAPVTGCECCGAKAPNRAGPEVKRALTTNAEGVVAG